MAILDFLKNKKEAEKAAPKKAAKKPSVAKKATAKVDSENSVQPAATAVNLGKFSYEAVRQPHISEKATRLAEKNQYVFKIADSQSKQEIRKSIEGLYNVNVLAVKKIIIPAKKRRLGKTEGFRKSYQKAIVTIKEGQKIEIL